MTGWGSDGEKKHDYVNSVLLDDCNGKLKMRDENIDLGSAQLCVGGERGFADCLGDFFFLISIFFTQGLNNPWF